jgi:hypothetical protein
MPKVSHVQTMNDRTPKEPRFLNLMTLGFNRGNSRRPANTERSRGYWIS